MPNLDNQTIQLIIIGVAGLAVVMQAVVLIAILFAIKKAAASMLREIKEMRASVAPIILDSSDFFARVAPQIESTTSDVAEIVHTVREKSVVIESSVMDILERAQRQSAQIDGMLNNVIDRTQRQTARVDGMVTNALNSVDKVGGFVADSVGKPVRRISALVAAGKAIVQSMRATASHPNPAEPGNQDRLA